MEVVGSIANVVALVEMADTKNGPWRLIVDSADDQMVFTARKASYNATTGVLPQSHDEMPDTPLKRYPEFMEEPKQPTRQPRAKREAVRRMSRKIRNRRILPLRGEVKEGSKLSGLVTASVEAPIDIKLSIRMTNPLFCMALLEAMEEAEGGSDDNTPKDRPFVEYLERLQGSKWKIFFLGSALCLMEPQGGKPPSSLNREAMKTFMTNLELFRRLNLQHEAVAKLEARLDEGLPTMDTLTNIGTTLLVIEEYGQAAAVSQHCLEIQERVPGVQAPDTLRTMVFLLRMSQGLSGIPGSTISFRRVGATYTAKRHNEWVKS
ncbi:hypothetical protein MKZ38_003286 [Zalerion maritima]|uniref:Uncharacterized protein n=1 Tax=Zalerion maritima TaxID=339359 RepID=A0AAD5WRY2_9PEZI|nr:hypothetical protein MKZ38_003286 [Zalerion maritima]